MGLLAGLLALSTFAGAALPSLPRVGSAAAFPSRSARPVVAASLIPFWWTQEQALAHYGAVRKEFLSSVKAIGAIPAEQRTFANTIQALEDVRARLEEQVATTGFLPSVSPDLEVRSALIGHFVSVLASDDEAYRAFQEYDARGEARDEPDQLLLKEMKRDFSLDGKGLDVAGVDRMQKLLMKLRELEKYFLRNIWRDHSFVSAAPSELAGLPPGLVSGFERTANGQAVIPVNVPATYRQVMSRARSPQLRERIEQAYSRIGAEFNGKNLDDALALRGEQARLLKRPSYAHLAMEGRSVKSPRAVARFLNGVRKTLMDNVRRESAELLALKKLDEPGASRLESRDIAYYTRRLRESRGFNEAEARAYFPTGRVIDAVLRRLETAFGVHFVEQTPGASWHPLVRLFALHDADGRRLASFYLDAYQRPDKTGGRFVQPLVRGRQLPDGSYREPLFAIVTNFDEPQEGRPSQLGHEELVGLMHELGHMLDDTLTQARYARFAGSSFGSGLDRAEVIPQLLEQLAWRPAFLASISGREDDASQPIPASLLDDMLAYARIGRARTIMTWAVWAAIDLALHALSPPRDVARLIDRLFVRFGLPPPPAGHMYQAAFSQLMGPYAAGYYTYLLGLNRALNLDSRFNLENPSVGADLRRSILAPGGEKELDAATRDFLGRDPDPKALERFLRTL